MKEGSIFASFQQTITVQVNQIENLRQGFIALLQIGDRSNQLHRLVLVGLAHGVPRVALCWLSDSGVHEREDITSKSNGSENGVGEENSQEMVQGVFLKTSTFGIVTISLGAFTVYANVAVEPADQLIGGFSGRVCTNNWGNSEEKWKHNYLEGLELIKSNTTLAFLFNTDLSSSNHLPNLACENEREDDDEDAPENVCDVENQLI